MSSSPKKSPRSRRSSVSLEVVPMEVDDPLPQSLVYKGLPPAQNDLMKELMVRGFAPVAKVAVPNDKEEKRIEFVFVVTQDGRRAFVVMDVAGEMDFGENDVVVSESASLVPLEAKIEAYECLELSVCGVAFVCQGEVCVLRRDDKTLEPMEKSFRLNQKTRTAYWANQVAEYPVVKFSDILANPDNVTYAITETIHRRRTNRGNLNYAGLQKLNQTIAETDRLYSEFFRLQDQTYQALASSLEQLDGYLAQSRQTGGMSPSHQEAIHRNLLIRNDKADQYLEMMSDLKPIVTSLDDVNRRLTDLVNGLTKNFQNLDRRLD